MADLSIALRPAAPPDASLIFASAGAELMRDWTMCRLDSAALSAFATEAGAP